MRAKRWQAYHGGGHGGRGSDERGKRQYALTEAQLMQPTHRGGGGGCGTATVEMEMAVVRCCACKAMAEARRCSAAAVVAALR